MMVCRASLSVPISGAKVLSAAFFWTKAHQVGGLNESRSVPDGKNLAVARVLFHRVFLGEAVAAQNLNGVAAHFKDPVAAVAFNQRGDEFNALMGFFAVFFVGAVNGDVFEEVGLINQSAHAFRQ